MFLGEYVTGSDPEFKAPSPKASLRAPRFPTRQDLEPYSITDMQPDTRRHGKKKIKEEGILFTTKGKGTWFVVTPKQDQRLTEQVNVPYLNGAKNELWNRQRFRPNRPSEQDHTDNVLFLAALPEDIIHTIYYGQDVPHRKAHYLLPYVEINLNDLLIIRTQEDTLLEEPCGQAAIMNIGTDGQLIMTEIGGSSPRRKSSQIARHALGAEYVIREANHGNVPPISRFVAIYQKPNPNTDFTVLRIQPASINRLKHYEGAIVQQQKAEPVEIFRRDRVAYN